MARPECADRANRKNFSMNMSDVLAHRLREVRLAMYGEHGGPLLAEALAIPARTWTNYESSVSIPGLVLLRFIAITGVEPHWLLTGEGQRFPTSSRPPHMARFQIGNQWQ
jgi:hypothetical protein